MSQTERDLTAILRDSMRREGLTLKKGADVPPSHNDHERGPVKLPRVGVDFTITLPWLLGATGVLLWGLISMYFQLMDVSKSLEQLKQDVRSSNQTTIQLAKDQAVIAFRLDKLEHDRERDDRK